MTTYEQRRDKAKKYLRIAMKENSFLGGLNAAFSQVSSSLCTLGSQLTGFVGQITTGIETALGSIRGTLFWAKSYKFWQARARSGRRK
jgi:phage-related minor tail protein